MFCPKHGGRRSEFVSKGEGGEWQGEKIASYLIRQSYEHERVARPDVEMIPVQQICRITADGFGRPCRHLQLEIVVWDIFLLKIHAAEKTWIIVR